MARAIFRPIVFAVALTTISIGVVVQGGAGPHDAAASWELVGGNRSNARYSALTQINTQTISKIGATWMSEKFGANAPSRATPIVKDGLMFVTAGPSIYAFNAKSGDTVWRYDSRGETGAPGAAASPSKEGLALGDGLVFAGLANGDVLAIEQKTGKVAWRQYVGDVPHIRGQSSVGAPTYADGIVFVGLNADRGFRGQAIALDAKTGRLMWRFFVVPGPGERGHDTWPASGDAWKTGGGAIWLEGAVDAELGLVYFVTGNGVPQHGGEVRAGDNLYLCSVIALEMKTGRLRWHYQAIHHDIWEADLSIAPVLFDGEVGGGRMSKGIAAMRGDGYLFLLDRSTGKPLMPIEERTVPQDPSVRSAATQPFPVGADRVLPDCEEWKAAVAPRGFQIGCFFAPTSFKTPNLLAPFFGTRVSPMAYSPETGFFYATGNAWLRWRRRAQDPYFFSPDRRIPGVSDHAVLAAIDGRTNKIVWKKEFRTGRLPGGAMPTAGGLMFQAAGDGNIEAYDAKTGSRLWQFQTGSIGGGPVMAYELDGDEYVAVASTRVFTFKLGGTLQPMEAPRIAAEEAFPGPIVDANQIETATLARDMGLTGSRQMVDEYTFNPTRTRVKVGTPVTWINNGTTVHTVIAVDGSWTTGPLGPIQAGVVTFDKPGTYTYTCKEHPWAAAQIIVVP